MKMTFRWYGSQLDPIPLRYIKQIPNMSGVVTSLMDLPAGALWPTERISALKEEVNAAGLEMANSILYFFISSSLPSVQSVDSVRRSGDTSRCGPVPPRQAPEYAWSSSPSGTGSGGDTGSRRAA